MAVRVSGDQKQIHRFNEVLGTWVGVEVRNPGRVWRGYGYSAALGENDEVGRQNTVLSKLNNTLRNLSAPFGLAPLGETLAVLLISRWNLGEAVVRSLCEEPLCTSWNMGEGQGLGGCKCK